MTALILFGWCAGSLASSLYTLAKLDKVTLFDAAVIGFVMLAIWPFVMFYHLGDKVVLWRRKP